MFTENGVLIDLEEVGKVVEASDVFTIGFRVFPQRVIIDTQYLRGIWLHLILVLPMMF